MSSNKPPAGPNENGEQPEKVQDDGKVDKRIKDRIIDARERVDRREDELFVRAPADPNISLSQREKLSAWSTSVRQYIRTIIPLLKSENIEEASYYWHDVEIWETRVAPPDKTHQWSRFARPEVDDKAVAKSMGLPAIIDPPKPKKVRYEGLKEILERDGVQLQWVVDLAPQEPGSADVEVLETAFPIPKQALENATTAADEFLQQAGVGLEIGSGKAHGKT